MTELKPCPLCGSEARIEKSPMVGLVAIVCGCSSHVFFGVEYDEKKAIEAWNKRTPEGACASCKFFESDETCEKDDYCYCDYVEKPMPPNHYCTEWTPKAERRQDG